MPTHDHIEALVRELTLAEPKLASRTPEVRAVVSAFLTHKPDVSFDQSARKKLREALLGEVRAVPSPFYRTVGILARLAPIGAVVVLILMLMPQSDPVPMNQTVLAPARDERIIDTRSGGGAPSRAQESFGMGGDQTAMDKSAPMLMSDTVPQPAAPSMPPLSIDTQPAGIRAVVREVRLSAPGFVLIATDPSFAPGTVIGVSPRLAPGTTTNVPVSLFAPMYQGTEYAGGISLDDGDGTWTLERDHTLPETLVTFRTGE